MAGHRFATDTARVGVVKGLILKTAMFNENLSSAGTVDPMPKNQGKTYKWKRFIVPLGYDTGAGVDNQWVAAGKDDDIVNWHRTAEGVTRGAESITSTIIEGTPYKFDVLYTYTDETAELYEDDIPMQEVEFAGKRIRLVRELYNYGKLKAATNGFYGGTGTSTETVNGTVTKAKLDKIKRDLKRLYCEPQHKALKSGPEYAVYPIQQSYPVYCHTDLEYDIRNLPDFKGVEEYGSQQPIAAGEIGAAYGFRFILAAELTYYPAGGAAVGSTSLKADDSTNIDVYPMIVLGQDAFRQLALRGMNSISANHIPHTQASKSDPGRQRGYVWAGTWHGAEITNQDWMAVLEVGVTAL
jgi:N4-gp56 family major capsid protein